MIIFGITIILIICVIAFFIMLGIFHRMPDMAIPALVLAICFATISGCIWAVAQEDRDAIITDYEWLTNYQSVVEYTDNEYVRYDYYQRVQEYNDTYENYMKNSNSIWVAFFYKDLPEEVQYFEFYLNQGGNDYYG